MPLRGPLSHTSIRWRHEGQRQYKPDGMDWAAKNRPAPPSPGVTPAGETVPSRRHDQTDSESGKEANEADTEEVPVSPSFFFCYDVRRG